MERQNQPFCQIPFTTFEHKCWAFSMAAIVHTQIWIFTILDSSWLDYDRTFCIRPTKANSLSSSYSFPSYALLDFHLVKFVKFSKTQQDVLHYINFYKQVCIDDNHPPTFKIFFHLIGHHTPVVVPRISINNLTTQQSTCISSQLQVMVFPSTVMGCHGRSGLVCDKASMLQVLMKCKSRRLATTASLWLHFKFDKFICTDMRK
jgi:hypothetical protein